MPFTLLQLLASKKVAFCPMDLHGRWAGGHDLQACISGKKEASPRTRSSRSRCIKPQRHTSQATRTDMGDNGRGKQGNGSVTEVNRLVMTGLSSFTGESESGSF